MTRYLVPPARFSNAVLLVLAVTVAGLVSWAAGLVAVTLVGLLSAAYLFAALRLFAYGKPVYEVVASLFSVLAAVGLLATPAIALALAGARYGGLRVLIAFLVPLVFVAGLVVLGQEYLPETGTAEFNRAVDSLLFTAALFTAAALGLLVLGLVLPAVDVGQVVDDGLGALVETATATPLAQLGSLVFLLGSAVYLAVRVGGLPLVGRAGRWAAAAVGPEVDEAAAGPLGDVRAALAERAVAIRHLGEGLAIVAAFVVMAGALEPTLSAHLRPFTGRFPVGVVFADAAPVHRALARLAAALVGVGVAHRVAWWLVHIDWGRYGARATRVAGPGLLLAVVALASGPGVDALLRTPAAHYVLATDAGVVLELTAERVQVVEFDPQLAALGLERSSAAFVPAVRALVGHLGAPFVLLAPLAVLFDAFLLAILVSWLVTAIGWVFLFGSFELASDARIGIGLLFVGTVAAATLRLSPRYPLVAVVLTLLAWDLHRLTTSLRLHLDPRASTLRGELVHLGTNAVVLVGVVAVTLAGQRLMGAVPAPSASWQGLAALVFALAAAVSSLVAVSLSGD